MEFAVWCLIAGGLLVAMALLGSTIRRLPVSAAMLYGGVGFALGPSGAGLLSLDPARRVGMLEWVAEAALLVSLFAAGLKLRTPLRDRLWDLPVRLAFLSMVLTVALVAAVGVWGLGLSPGAAVLLGAIVAPTDPVLAAEVQVEGPWDQDRLRFGLTGEAALNDGTAYPVALLGLGLLGLHDLGAGGWRWLLIDVLWAVPGGLLVGGLLGDFTGRLVLRLRQQHREAVGMDAFLTLGLIALAYGLAGVARADGFLAVFAAGLGLGRVERRRDGGAVPTRLSPLIAHEHTVELATNPATAPAYMARAALGFAEQMEQFGEVVAVVLLGSVLSAVPAVLEATWFVPVLLFGIRPVAVLLGLFGTPTSRLQRGLTAWFGIRGVGTLYYLLFAIRKGLPPEEVYRFASLALTTVAVSIVVHGLSVTPLMNLYSRSKAH